MARVGEENFGDGQVKLNFSSRHGWLAGVFLACMSVALSACATGSSPAKAEAASQSRSGIPIMGSAEALSKADSSKDAADYRVGPQDLLEIAVFQVPDLNRTVRVNTSGEISLPLIGMVQAGGRTVQEVEQDISAKLSKSFLQNPQVSVFVKEFTSQRVTLEGAVAKSGIFPITGQTSLLQAIAMAGGLGELADPKAVVIFRVIEGKKKAAVFDLTQIRKGTAEDPMIYGDDIVVVQESGSKSLLSRIMKAMPAMGIFTLL